MEHSDSAFILDRNGSKIVLLVYVGDTLVISKSEDLISEVKKELLMQFKMKDLGPVQCFLNVEIDRVRGIFHLDQAGDIQKILDYHNMSECKPVTTPMDPGIYSEITSPLLPSISEIQRMETVQYREAIGHFLDLSTRTKPVIAFAVNIVSRAVSRPRPIHSTAVKWVLRFLKAIKYLKLSLQANGCDVIEYSDAD